MGVNEENVEEVDVYVFMCVGTKVIIKFSNKTFMGIFLSSRANNSSSVICSFLCLIIILFFSIDTEASGTKAA